MSYAPTPVIEKHSNVYGPVRSRRLGVSLGVNVGSAEKICTWNCVYCQFGFKRTIGTERNIKYVLPEVIFQQIIEKLEQNPEITSLTFAGNTEPGLYPHLFTLLRKLKQHQVKSRARWKTVILTNGSELDNEDVVRAFNFADETWVKLDCGTAKDFHRFNMPGKETEGFVSHLNRVRKLKKVKIQTMLWTSDKADFSNSNPEQLRSLLCCFKSLQPSHVQLYTISRAPAWAQLQPVNLEIINNFANQIRELEIECDTFIS